jgi:TolB protein
VIAAVAFGAWQLLRRDSGTDWEPYAAGARMVRISTSEEPTFGPSLSPDGRMVCYVQQAADGHTDVYVGRIAGGARIRLTNDRAVEESPRFSADGELVAFTRVPGPDLAPELRVVPALGGDPVSTISGGSSPAWSRDGRLAYVRREEGGRLALVVSAMDGTNPKVILPRDGVYWALRNPAWSPDGRYVVVVRSTGGAAGEMWLVPARAGQPRRLVDEPATTFSESPAFTPDGRGVIHSSNRGGATNL